MCSGHCTEFDIHLRAAKNLMQLHGQGLSLGNFVEERLIWCSISGFEQIFTKNILGLIL